MKGNSDKCYRPGYAWSWTTPRNSQTCTKWTAFKHNRRKSLFSFYSKIGRIYPQLYWNIMRNVCFETTFTSWERLRESDMLILTFKHLHVCLQNTKRNKNKTRLCGQNHIMYTPINEIHHFNSLKQILVYLFFKQSAALSRDVHNSQSRHL